MDNRKYDKSLIDKIHEKEYIDTSEGIEILYKPVPDDDRPHAMDPRLYEIASKKKRMFASRAKGGFKLSNERYRPDKVTYDLCTVDIDTDERLISINNDHMIDIYIYRRTDLVNQKDLPAMVYLHGGGFTAGDVHLYEKQMKLIAELSNGVVIFPEYRLAPECPFPGPIDDAYGAIDYVFAHADELGINPKKVMVAGDSAGGSLTNACVLKDEKKRIAQIVELYSAFDGRNYHDVKEYTWSYDEYQFLDEQKDIEVSRVERIKAPMDNPSGDAHSLYLQGKTTSDDPLVSAICASDEILSAFPPATLIYSEFDFLRVGDIYAGKKLKSLGVDVKMICYCGCDHGFLDMLGTVVQAEEVCGVLADVIKSM